MKVQRIAKPKAEAPVTNARAEIAAMEAKYLNKSVVEEERVSISVPARIGAGLDAIDATRQIIAETLYGDNNVFAQIRLEQMKRKEARGGYKR